MGHLPQDYGWRSLLLKKDNGLTEIVVVFFLNKLIYLFLAASGLCCCAPAFSSCGEQGLLFVAMRGLLIAVASLVVEHRL